jgi:hypothetical protein
MLHQFTACVVLPRAFQDVLLGQLTDKLYRIDMIRMHKDNLYSCTAHMLPRKIDGA